MDFFDPYAILVYCKMIDIAGEAVPGLIIQLYAKLALSGTSNFSYVSLSISTATIAFGVVMLFYEKDTTPSCRASNPSFYGAIRDGVAARFATVLVLMVFTMCHVFSKCFGLALLWVTFGGQRAASFWLADLMLYFIIKGAQRDFIFWLPSDNWALTAFISFFCRVGNKVETDFTAWPQQRHVWGKWSRFSLAF